MLQVLWPSYSMRARRAFRARNAASVSVRRIKSYLGEAAAAAVDDVSHALDGRKVRCPCPRPIRSRQGTSSSQPSITQSRLVLSHHLRAVCVTGANLRFLDPVLATQCGRHEQLCRRRSSRDGQRRRLPGAFATIIAQTVSGHMSEGSAAGGFS